MSLVISRLESKSLSNFLENIVNSHKAKKVDYSHSSTEVKSSIHFKLASGLLEFFHNKLLMNSLTLMIKNGCEKDLTKDCFS